MMYVVNYQPHNLKDEECDGGMVQTANPSEESSVKRGVGQVVGGLVITKLNYRGIPRIIPPGGIRFLTRLRFRGV
jgi:hypothetical protein